MSEGCSVDKNLNKQGQYRQFKKIQQIEFMSYESLSCVQNCCSHDMLG